MRHILRHFPICRNAADSLTVRLVPETRISRPDQIACRKQVVLSLSATIPVVPRKMSPALFSLARKSGFFENIVKLGHLESVRALS